VIERLREAVRRRHPEADGRWWITREWQRIDMLCVECWHPFRRVVYELKTSRADLLAELRNPAKREAAWQIADEFWFVYPCGFATHVELPTGAGSLLVRPDGSAVVERPALRLVSREFTRAETADLLRRQLNPFDRQRELRELRMLRRVVDDRGIAC
jgi:hypothetical protein